jgi:hypothetical protein
MERIRYCNAFDQGEQLALFDIKARLARDFPFVKILLAQPFALMLLPRRDFLEFENIAHSLIVLLINNYTEHRLSH